jgi:hypothetical protein
MPAVEVISRLRDHYGEDALSRTQTYFGINEIKRGRTDLNNIASPGREPREDLAGAIFAKLNADPHLAARKLAKSLRIAASTVCRDLKEVLGMKCRHLRWVPHTLTAVQKVVRAELAERKLQALAKHERSHFHFSFTGDESWMFYAYNHWTMWVLFWDGVDEIERLSHFQQKTMLAIFFNRTGEYKIAILAAGQKMNSRYFMECVLGPLTEVWYPDGWKSHRIRVTLHFDNVPIHNLEELQGHWTALEFTGMEHPPCSPIWHRVTSLCLMQ